MKVSTIIFFFSLITFFACKKDEPYDPDLEYIRRETSNFELRQLIQKETTTTNSHGSYFLIGGSYNSETKHEEWVKVFAKVDTTYRLISIPLNDIRINVDNNLITPSLKISYVKFKLTDNDVVDYPYTDKLYIISCPEKYLPEKLLPINL